MYLENSKVPDGKIRYYGSRPGDRSAGLVYRDRESIDSISGKITVRQSVHDCTQIARRWIRYGNHRQDKSICWINTGTPGDRGAFLFGGDGDRAHWAGAYTRTLCKILPSEAFLKRIFGEDMWKILEKYNRVNRPISISDFRIDYTIRPLKDGKDWKHHDPDQFEVYLRMSDRVRYSESNKPSFGYSDGDFKEEDFNFIGFRFIFDIEKNKIRDVKFCDKVCVNGELIAQGETEETTWDLY